MSDVQRPTPSELDGTDKGADVRQVELSLCDLCLDGAGGECHTPGCALYLNRAPDLALRNSPMVGSIDGARFCQQCGEQRVVPGAHCSKCNAFQELAP